MGPANSIDQRGSTNDDESDTASGRRRPANLLNLVRDSDSIELKLTVPEFAYRSTAAASGVDPLDAEIRQVFFFDTPELTLNKAGLVAPGSADPAQGQRLGRQAAPRRSQ